MFVARVERDQEVIDTIGRHARKRGVVNASLTLVGAVKGCTVSVMPNGDLDSSERFAPL